MRISSGAGNQTRAQVKQLRHVAAQPIKITAVDRQPVTVFKLLPAALQNILHKSTDPADPLIILAAVLLLAQSLRCRPSAQAAYQIPLPVPASCRRRQLAAQTHCMKDAPRIPSCGKTTIGIPPRASRCGICPSSTRCPARRNPSKLSFSIVVEPMIFRIPVYASLLSKVPESLPGLHLLSAKLPVRGASLYPPPLERELCLFMLRTFQFGDTTLP